MLFIEVKQRCQAIQALTKLKRDFAKLEGWRLDRNQTAIAISFCSHPLTKRGQSKVGSKLNGLKDHVKLGFIYGILVTPDGVYPIPEKLIETSQSMAINNS